MPRTPGSTRQSSTASPAVRSGDALEGEDACRTFRLVKAAVCTRYGPPDVVRIAEVDKPTAGDNEVLVKVHATTVNRTDCALPGGQALLHAILHRAHQAHGSTVLGNEFAGVVEAVGSGVTSFAVGDKVFGYNEGPFGAHAEYLSIPEDGSLATMPANVTYEEAAASTEGSHYALAHIRAAKIQQRAGRPRLRRDRSDRLGGGPAPEESRCQRDRGLRHGAHGAGQGPGRRPGHRLHGRGLHEGRADIRRGPRRGRQELVRPVQAAAEARRDLPLVGAGSVCPEPDPGAHHAAASAARRSCSPFRSTTRRWWGTSRS